MNEDTGPYPQPQEFGEWPEITPERLREFAEAVAWTVTEESVAEARRVLSAWAWSSADFDVS